QIFSTAADNQTSVEIHVLQGERPMAQDNKTLGRFILDGIPPAPRGLPQVEVSFDIDANGILNVSAKDKASGKTQSIKIEGSAGISKEEIEKMKKDAELHAEEDKKKQDAIEAKNIADALIYTSEKTLKDNEAKATEPAFAESFGEVKQKIEMLKKAKESDNIEEIKKSTQVLSEAIQKVGAELHKQTPKAEGTDKGSAEGTEEPSDEGKENDNTEEGKYTEK
ncbi:MAG: Hsp70 family protein, partial [Candidatus Staskawiczbacteria bacterium]|nr:Hsp70 family protein [Candidatus Staskawiczbacteria bacterium]